VKFGLLNYATAFVALFSSIADGGMQSVVVRELVRRQEREIIMCTALLMRLVGACIAILLAIGFASVLRHGDIVAVGMVMIMSLAMIPQAWDIIEFEHQSRMTTRPIFITRAVSFSIFSIVKVVLIATNAGVVSFAWAVVGEATFSAVMMSMLPHARLSLTNAAKISWTEMKFLFNTCWPMMIAGLSVMLYMRIDQIMLGQILGDRAVGTFSAAVRVSEAWYFVPVAVLSSFSPALLITMKESQQRYQEKLLSITRLLLWLSVVMATAISLGSRWIIHFLYGANYTAASSVLVVHAWAGVFVSLGVSGTPWFINAGLLRLKMGQSVAGAVINMAMNLYMIQAFGVVGAAISTLICQCFTAVLFNSLDSRTRPLFILQLKSVWLPLRSAMEFWSHTHSRGQ
jgi:PST family polysaccharide transporter